MRYNLVIKQGTDTVAVIPGRVDVDLRLGELEKILATEQFLEQLTGCRFHIIAKEK
ncbi:MAG TPA: hypothetical protein VNS88_17745 [Nitrospiraceae bacterium]|nr:hypothetical protein [Nitrospiraceae bacterium]